MDTYQKFLRPVILAVAAIAAISLVISINTSAAANEKAEAATTNLTYFTNFKLEGIDGETFTHDDLKDYKVTVVNGWAPWCGPCTSEIPGLDKLNEEYKSKGLQVIGVVADYYPTHVDGEADGYNDSIRDVIKSTGCRYINVVSDEAFYEGPYLTMNNSFPCTWAVDEHGNVIDIIHGRKSEEDWRGLFDRWLAGR